MGERALSLVQKMAADPRMGPAGESMALAKQVRGNHDVDVALRLLLLLLLLLLFLLLLLLLLLLL